MSQKLVLDEELVRDLAYGIVGEDYDGYAVVHNDFVETTRWSTIHELVIKDDQERYWAASYSKGATENQVERPFEYDEAKFTRVLPVEKTVVTYEEMS